MRPTRLATYAAVIVLALGVTAQANAAFQARVSIKGAKQGQLKGEAMGKGLEGWIPIYGFQYEVTSPRDLATGAASGKRQHRPITIVKEWGAATPQIFNALVSNEVLPVVVFQFLRTNANGEVFVFQTVTLTNATISSLKQYSGGLPGAPSDLRLLEDVSFTFQKIEIENKTGNTTAMDDWSAQG